MPKKKRLWWKHVPGVIDPCVGMRVLSRDRGRDDIGTIVQIAPRATYPLLVKWQHDSEWCREGALLVAPDARRRTPVTEDDFNRLLGRWPPEVPSRQPPTLWADPRPTKLMQRTPTAHLKQWRDYLPEGSPRRIRVEAELAARAASEVPHHADRLVRGPKRHKLMSPTTHVSFDHIRPPEMTDLEDDATALANWRATELVRRNAERRRATMRRYVDAGLL